MTKLDFVYQKETRNKKQTKPQIIINPPRTAREKRKDFEFCITVHLESINQ